MDTFSDIIKALGGYAVVAEALSLPPKSVSSMRTRDSVPPEHWPALAKHADSRGRPDITVEFLANLRRPRKARESQPADPAQPAPEPAASAA